MHLRCFARTSWLRPAALVAFLIGFAPPIFAAASSRGEPPGNDSRFNQCAHVLVFPNLKSLAAVTPKILRERSPLRGPNDIDAVKKAAERMTEADAVDVAGYLRIPTIAKNPYEVEASIKRANPEWLSTMRALNKRSPIEGYPVNEAYRVAGVYENMQYGLALLIEYDAIHKTDFAAPAGLRLLEQLEDNDENYHNDLLIQWVMTAVSASNNVKSIARFFDTVSSNETIDGYINDRAYVMIDVTRDLLDRVVRLEEKDRPNVNKLQCLLQEYVDVFATEEFHYDATSSIVHPKTVAQDMATVAEGYFRAIGEDQRARDFALQRLKLEQDLRKFYRDRSRPQRK